MGYFKARLCLFVVFFTSLEISVQIHAEVLQEKVLEMETRFTAVDGSLSRARAQAQGAGWSAWAGWKNTGATFLALRAGYLLVGPLRLGSDRADRRSIYIDTNAGDGSVGIAWAGDFPVNLWARQNGTLSNFGGQVYFSSSFLGLGSSWERSFDLSWGKEEPWIDLFRLGGRWGGKSWWVDGVEELERGQGSSGHSVRLQAGSSWANGSLKGLFSYKKDRETQVGESTEEGDFCLRPVAWWRGEVSWLGKNLGWGGWSVETLWGERDQILFGGDFKLQDRSFPGVFFRSGWAGRGELSPSVEFKIGQDTGVESLAVEASATAPRSFLPGLLRLTTRVERKSDPTLTTTLWRFEALWTGSSGTQASVVWTRRAGDWEEPWPAEIYGNQSSLSVQVLWVW
jgi:hypothetical protein